MCGSRLVTLHGAKSVWKEPSVNKMCSSRTAATKTKMCRRGTATTNPVGGRRETARDQNQKVTDALEGKVVKLRSRRSRGNCCDVRTMRLLLAWSHDKQSQKLVTLKPALGFAKATSSNPLSFGGGTNFMMHPSQTTATDDDTEAMGLKNYKQKEGRHPKLLLFNKHQSCFSEKASMDVVAYNWENLMSLKDEYVIPVKSRECVDINNQRDRKLITDFLTILDDQGVSMKMLGLSISTVMPTLIFVVK